MAGKPGAERISGEARDQLTQELVEAYRQGASIRDLAASSGRSYGLIHKLLGEAGVQLRARGGATRGRAQVVK
jgi:hypothetical protein